MSNNKSFNSNFNTLSSLRLSSNTPMQALGAKAMRAAAIAEVSRAEAKPLDRPTKNHRQKAKPEIERKLDSLKSAIRKSIGSDMEMACEKPGKYSSALTDIRVFNTAEISQFEDEMSRWEACGKPEGKKPRQVTPVVRYVVYPSVHDKDRIGSVAIYGSRIDEFAAVVNHLGHFMGWPVKSATVEVGLRPYLDVIFK